MLRVIYKKPFRKSLKKYKHNPTILSELKHVVNLLAGNKALPTKYKDHELKGNLKGIRELHLKPDDLLLYVKVEHESITLLNIGNHADLFKM
ncbi:MAG: type II toxin-antitoxin system YafQ family toxin [Pseudomonadota bacterium]